MLVLVISGLVVFLLIPEFLTTKSERQEELLGKRLLGMIKTICSESPGYSVTRLHHSHGYSIIVDRMPIGPRILTVSISFSTKEGSVSFYFGSGGPNRVYPADERSISVVRELVANGLTEIVYR